MFIALRFDSPPQPGKEFCFAEMHCPTCCPHEYSHPHHRHHRISRRSPRRNRRPRPARRAQNTPARAIRKTNGMVEYRCPIPHRPRRSHARPRPTRTLRQMGMETYARRHRPILRQPLHHGRHRSHHAPPPHAHRWIPAPRRLARTARQDSTARPPFGIKLNPSVACQPTAVRSSFRMPLGTVWRSRVASL
jgi:hypothetical protein